MSVYFSLHFYLFTFFIPFLFDYSFFLFLFPPFFLGGVGGWGNEAQFVSRSSETKNCYGRGNTMGCGFLKTDCQETEVTFFYHFWCKVCDCIKGLRSHD